MPIMYVAASIITALALFPAIVFGHDAHSGWAYPSECCSDKDCQHIDARRVKESGAGFTVTLDDQQFMVPHAKTRPSPDGEYHGCVSAAKAMLCFFVPPRGV